MEFNEFKKGCEHFVEVTQGCAHRLNKIDSDIEWFCVDRSCPEYITALLVEIGEIMGERDAYRNLNRKNLKELKRLKTGSEWFRRIVIKAMEILEDGRLPSQMVHASLRERKTWYMLQAALKGEE